MESTLAGWARILLSTTGQVTVVSPLWIDAGALLGNHPGAVKQHFEFVPEPGTVVLLVSGAVGLAVIGRRRMRRPGWNLL